MSTATFVGTRVQSPKVAAGLFVGDVLAVCAFVLAGTLDHGFDVDPVRVALTITPFLVGWLVVSFPAGLYGRRAVDLPLTGALALVCWTVAVLIGGALRGTAYFPGAAPGSFLLASLVFGGLLVVGWRVAAALFLGKQRNA